MYNILIAFDIPLKLLRPIQLCLTATYSKYRVGQNLSDICNGLKQDALAPLLFNFALECVIRRVRVNHNGLKLHGTHQLLVHDDDVNMLEVYIL